MQEFEATRKQIADEIQKDSVDQTPAEALRMRLLRIKQESNDHDAKAEVIMHKAKTLQAGLKDTLEACHKTIEFSGKCLADHFRNIPESKLNTEIAMRFKDFDKSGSGYLDKEELREALAEMGQRPSEEELDLFFDQCDKDKNGMIDEAEFGAMVRVKLGLIDAAKMEDAATDIKKMLHQASLRRRSSLKPEHTVSRRTSVSDLAPSARLPALGRRASSSEALPPFRRASSPENLTRRPLSSEGFTRSASAEDDTGRASRRRSLLSNVSAANPPQPTEWAMRPKSTTGEVVRDFARSKSWEGAEMDKIRRPVSRIARRGPGSLVSKSGVEEIRSKLKTSTIARSSTCATVGQRRKLSPNVEPDTVG